MNLERWQKFSLAEQMGNIGSEFSRAKHWEEKGDFDARQKALERMIELIDLTVSDKRRHSHLVELLRLREIICDLMIRGGNYDISLKSLQDYFLPFALSARK